MAETKKDVLAIVVASDKFDKALMPFFLGQVASSMDYEVHIYFTFFGLNLLKKGFKPKLPGLFRLFTGMIEKKMKANRIQSFQEMLASAPELDMKLYACSTSMTIMGVKKEQLIPGCQVVGAATFLDVANNARTTLFIS